MSFLSLSSNLVKLRKDKGITQEALAEFAGVTKASVSKWETGMTTPDIQLLPILAAFFDVSVDELLGYEAQLSKQQIKYYYHKLAKEFATKDVTAVWEESRELVKKYYGCYDFLMQMAILWLNHSMLAESDADKNEILKQVEELCNRILTGSKDSLLLENATSIRAMVWLQQGREKQVIESMQAEVLDVNRIGDRGELLSMAYLTAGQLEQAKKCTQIGMYRSITGLLGNGMYLIMSCEDEMYCREVVHRLDQVMKTFKIKSLNPNLAAAYEYQVAVKLCGSLAAAVSSNAGNADCDKQTELLQQEILQRLEAYTENVVILYGDKLRIHGDVFFNELENWFSQLELGTEAVRDAEVVLRDTISALKNPVFDLLSDKKRINHCIRSLEKQLGKAD